MTQRCPVEVSLCQEWAIFSGYLVSVTNCLTKDQIEEAIQNICEKPQKNCKTCVEILTHFMILIQYSKYIFKQQGMQIGGWGSAVQTMLKIYRIFFYTFPNLLGNSNCQSWYQSLASGISQPPETIYIIQAMLATFTLLPSREQPLPQ